MAKSAVFRSARLTGRPPEAGAGSLYAALFGEDGPRRLLADRDAWRAGRVAPWILSHAGHEVGVGGFRHGADAPGFELSFHFLPEVWGQGLASEFVQAALDAATVALGETEIHAWVDDGGAASIHILEKAGFSPASDGAPMRLTLPPPPKATP